MKAQIQYEELDAIQKALKQKSEHLCPFIEPALNENRPVLSGTWKRGQGDYHSCEVEMKLEDAKQILTALEEYENQCGESLALSEFSPARLLNSWKNYVAALV
jgi:hypothetical protein